ncbi:NFX1-type zinc finger-containing protein 1 isoform X2 [Oopsacas minuta]|uniref:NFX1-type zinc finger-containing protein 1 isoform X2 n=1 Tax=Oopsacas minuta TaxID=111878 RepID=A0AAV7JEV1_9METZ|nr:NFX1-type zinc finger-containing protein 1 isoform X2 [Oopsacas minuta]
MIESREIYFEAYSHTLSVLQDTYEDTLPFKDILLGYVNTCEAPEYIDEDTILNIGDMGIDTNEFRVVDEWPVCVGINDSQFRALKYAFSSRVALIQGPPGTGKTHVGLSILKILLRTRATQMRVSYADPRLKESLCDQPILILTQSNHVLDQFLELIMIEDRNIVRIGSRSESEIIKAHSLSEIRKYFWKGDKPSLTILNLRSAQISVRKELDRLEKIIEKYARDFQNATKFPKTIISEETLRIVASKEHFDSLYDTHQAGFKVVMNKRQSMCDIWLRELGLQAKLGEILLTKQIPLEKNPFAIIAAKDLTIPDGNIIDKYLILERRVEYLDLKEEIEVEETATSNPQSPIKPQETRKAIKERKILEEASKKFKQAIKENQKFLSQDIPDRILETRNLWVLKQEDRELLYKYWVKRMIHAYGLVVKSYSDKYASKIKQLEVINTSIDLYILKQATIVGMTTTGAARNSKLIRKLKPRIVIVDEAGEVLEAHIITSLSQTVEHLIMIGDPQMLKPSTAVSRLSDQFNLNLSLFERLIINDFRHATLTLQHRMRPEISSIMRLIYPMMEDNHIVADYEHINGITNNMYFVSHNFYEDKLAEDSTSRANTYEAKFVVELALYLVKRGYKQDEITILTFYNDQKYLIEDSLAKRIRDNVIKVSTVDKFQGEENEIILLSIVRGNKENYIGHCCVDNRTGVAFSRARSGFYVIGNGNSFRIASKKTTSGLWERILDLFTELNCIGSSLQLYCRLHGEFYDVVNSEDFKRINADGCFKSCEKSATINLSQKCNKSHPCGHHCLGKIGEDCSQIPCLFNKTKQMNCGHELHFPCSLSTSDVLSLKCEIKCEFMLKCGHACKGTCFLCYHGNHLECIEKCGRNLVCNHDCSENCHYPYECPPCRKVMTNNCEHIKSSILCGDSRVLCTKPCEWKCEHLECTMKCSEICDRPRCNDRCSLLLNCGHVCMGICGEKCPPICRKCKSFDENFQKYFGDEQNAFANFIILQDCGHIFEVSGLDRHVKKSLKTAGINQLPQCPKCSTFILKPFRYQKQVNRIICNIEKVKHRIAKDNIEIIQENLEKLREFLSQNILHIQLLKQLEKTPIFMTLQGDCKYTNLHIFSELLKILVAFFTQDYPLEVWTEDTPIMNFFNSEQLEYLLNISPKDSKPDGQRVLKELLLKFRICPLYTIFKLADSDKLQLWENKLFTEIKTKFNSQTAAGVMDEMFLAFCEAFLFRINESYNLNFPAMKYESFRRKVTDNAIGWGVCIDDHVYEILEGKEPNSCPVCKK